MESWWLIVGLGNPGERYTQTRHNAGFLLVDRLAEETGAVWQEQPRWEAVVAPVQMENQKVVLCKPLTYMNRSGLTVGAAVRSLDLPLNQLLVVVDDVDLPLGTIRMKPGGGTAGHHGLESIQAALGTQQFPRQRLGIGREDLPADLATFVLAPFEEEEWSLFQKVLTCAAEQVRWWIREGIEKAMSRWNGPVEPFKKREER